MFECCHKCVPPKRYPGCGDHCKEYKDTKARIAEMKAADAHRRGRDVPTVYAQQMDSIARAERKRKKKR